IVTSLPMSDQPLPLDQKKTRPVPPPPSREERDDAARVVIGLLEHLDASLDVIKPPALPLQGAAHFLAADAFQTSISITLSSALDSSRVWFPAAWSHPSAASLMFANASSSVSPSEKQPGRAGTSTE